MFNVSYQSPQVLRVLALYYSFLSSVPLELKVLHSQWESCSWQLFLNLGFALVSQLLGVSGCITQHSTSDLCAIDDTHSDFLSNFKFW